MAPKPPRLSPVLWVEGALLAASAKELVYASYVVDAGRRASDKPRYRDVVAMRLPDTPGKLLRRNKLYSFKQVDSRNRVAAVQSSSRGRVAVFVEDAARNRHVVLVFDQQSNDVKQHEHHLALPLPDEAAARFSHREDYLVLVERLAGRLRLWRYDIEKGKTAPIAMLPARDGHAGRIFGLGVLPDNRTVWLHRGDELMMFDLRSKRRKKSIALARLARQPKPKWNGIDRFFPKPNQFYIGLANGTFVLVRR